jgi:Flagellar hook-length control protein FliK
LIDAALAKALETLVRLVRAPLLELPGKLPTQEKWQPGQEVRARVEKILSESGPAARETRIPTDTRAPTDARSSADTRTPTETRALVRIGEQTYEMRLPAQPKAPQAGDSLRLVYVGERARPTFLLVQPSGQQQPGKVSLSESARVLGAVLDQATASTAKTSAATAAAPLLAMPPSQSKELAQALTRALVQSGLFYESHQAEWVAGRRPLETLLQEPQARLSQPQIPAPAADKAAPAQVAVAQTQASPSFGAAASNPAQPETGLVRLAESAPSPAGPVSAQPAAKEALPVNPASLPLVRQQLDVMDGRQIVWQGEVWPGQPLRWLVESPPEHEAGAGGQAYENGAAVWHTRLDLALPRLGNIAADVWLTPQGMHLAFTADKAAHAAMRAETASLSNRIATAGLNLTGIQWQDE